MTHQWRDALVGAIVCALTVIISRLVFDLHGFSLPTIGIAVAFMAIAAKCLNFVQNIEHELLINHNRDYARAYAHDDMLYKSRDLAVRDDGKEHSSREEFRQALAKTSRTQTWLSTFAFACAGIGLGNLILLAL